MYDGNARHILHVLTFHSNFLNSITSNSLKHLRLELRGLVGTMTAEEKDEIRFIQISKVN
jgi:hypothetical protein